MRFDIFEGVSGDIAQTQSYVNLRPRKCLRDLRKKKGKMLILAAKSRPCKQGRSQDLEKGGGLF